MPAASGSANRRVRAAASRVALQTLLDCRPSQLSGGQQQRVALARAIVRNPSVYLMDEPLSNLDAQLRLQTRTELKRLHKELGTTMVYVTNARRRDDLYHRPANTFVAAFLGSPAMNILDVGQEGTGNRIGIRPEDVQIATTPQAGWEAARAASDLIVDADQELWIRLPPERLHTFDAGGARLP